MTAITIFIGAVSAGFLGGVIGGALAFWVSLGRVEALISRARRSMDHLTAAMRRQMPTDLRVVSGDEPPRAA